MKDIYTKEQTLLSEYLKALNIPLSRRLYIMAILWDEKATLQMLKYIAKTEEQDHSRLLSAALKISKKYEA